MLNLIISLLVSLTVNPFAWNTHHYPKKAEHQFMTICKRYGGTEEQCTCNMTKGEAAWTIKQAYHQGVYYIFNGKLTDEAWAIHASCLQKEK